MSDTRIAVIAQPNRSAQPKRRGGTVIKLRITADTAADAEQARVLLEQLLASLHCHMRPPRAGANPHCASPPIWLSYGAFVLPAPATKLKRASNT